MAAAVERQRSGGHRTVPSRHPVRSGMGARRDGDHVRAQRPGLAEVGARRSALKTLVLKMVSARAQPVLILTPAERLAVRQPARQPTDAGRRQRAAALRLQACDPLSLEEVHADVWRERCSPLLRRVMESSHAAQRAISDAAVAARGGAAAAPRERARGAAKIRRGAAQLRL